MDSKFKRSAWLLGAAGVALALSTGPALAQDDNAADNESVVVVGQRAMMRNAINRQRNADIVQNVITRDAIGQFPDQNVAEAVRRVSGVNILNDQGEGRFVSVRGLDPALNASSINGVRLPSPEADTRAVALDVIAAELVESIEIKKTLTPDMDADTIGASIEINTTRAFDRDEPFFSATLEGSYNDLNGETSPKGSIDFSVPISDTFGIAGGLSYYDRKTSTDNIEADGWSEFGGFGYAESVEYRDYDVERERFGATLSFDWKANDTTTLFARALYSQFDDFEERRRLIFDDTGTPLSITADTATFLSDDGDDVADPDDRGTITLRRDIKDRFESQVIETYQIGSETIIGPWEARSQLAYAHAEEHEFRTTDPTRFEYEEDVDGALGFTFDYSNVTLPTFTLTPGLEASFSDPTAYEFDERADIDGLAEDDEWSGRFDILRHSSFNSGDLTWQAGLKFRLREKSYSANSVVYDGVAGIDYTLADVAGSGSYGLFDIGVVPDLGLTRAFNSDNLASFEENADDSIIESFGAAYTVEEDIYAGYAMGTWRGDRTTIIAGVRVEQTEDDLSGNLLDEDNVDTITALNFTNSYTDVLPSVNVRYNYSDEIVLRGAVFASIVRPKIDDLAPYFITNEDLELEAGNPDLDPYRAWNFDLSAEYYFAPGGIVQVGVFYKDIQDFIVDRTFDAADAPYMGVYNGVSFSELNIAINGGDATVAGMELNYQQALTFLPGIWDGLLVGFNYTYTDTEGDIGDYTIPLPAAARNTYNAMVGYEKGGLSLRLTAAYRDRYLDELNGDPLEDRYVDEHLQIDASAKYRLNENFQIYSEFVNLTDEPYVAYQRGIDGVDDTRQRLLQYEEYSYTAKFGVRYTH